MGVKAAARGRAAAQAVGGSRPARVVARLGLISRTVFYLVLAGLVVEVAVDGGSAGRQTNANGAMTAIAQNAAGKGALAAAALGFLVLGVVRVGGAVRDHGSGTPQRLLAGAQGVFYAAVMWVPLSFLFGSRQTGSEQAQQQETSSVLSWPGGRVLVICAGLVVLGVCAFQIWSAVTQD